MITVTEIAKKIYIDYTMCLSWAAVLFVCLFVCLFVLYTHAKNNDNLFIPILSIQIKIDYFSFTEPFTILENFW